MAARVIRWRGRRRVQIKLRFHADPRETPMYGVREAADYVGVARSTLRHWLAKTTHGDPIIQTPDGGTSLSFSNLLEAHVLRVAVERNVRLERLRVTVNTLRDRKPDSIHPLLENELRTGGPYRSIFIKGLSGEIEDVGHGGQLVLRQLVSSFLKRIDFDSTGPYQLRPYGFQHVAINYRIGGGQPVVKNTGILIEVIAGFVRAGDDIDSLARDYRLSRADIRDAVRYARAA